MKKRIRACKRVVGVIMSLTLLVSSSVYINADDNAMSGNEELSAEEVIPYLDTSLSFEERAADLVSRMTLEEKISQLGNNAPAIPGLEVGAYNYWREGLHGVARQGVATSFPTSLSMSNTWNRSLIYSAADITSTEARGINNKLNLSYWSPTINMARDPRWGRNEETYGEDPYLTSQIASEFVKGMQGDDPKYLKVIATLKHFIANNCEKERRAGSSKMDEKTLREYYARAFKDTVEAVSPASVMSSYNATTVMRNGETLYDHIPSAANPYILTELLRRNWGFDGYVTGDCGAVQDLGGTEVGGKQNVYKEVLVPGKKWQDTSAAESIAKGFYAGNDIDCGSAAQSTQLEAVLNGYLSEDQLDVNIYRLFLQRMRTGEFDSADKVPYRSITSETAFDAPPPGSTAKRIEKDEHVQVAERAAEETWVLLKNEGNILPIGLDKKNIAIVGNYADEIFRGDYSGDVTKTTTPLQGLKKEFPNATIGYLGGVPSDAALFNLKSLTFILDDNTTRKIDLSKATSVMGGTLSNGMITEINKNFSAVIPNVDFSKVKSVKAEMSSAANFASGQANPGGTLKIGYGDSTLTVANVSSKTSDTYVECMADYTGNTGGYNGKRDLSLTVSANAVKDFSVTDYKDELDKADIIIAYAGTNLKDSSESNDRESIDFPASQSHVKALADAYGNKTIVAMQTVGQMNVEDIKDKVAAILWTSYNGQTQGEAFAKVISGTVNPSGRLTTTWYPVSDLIKMPLTTTAENKKTINGVDYYYNDYNIAQKTNFPGRTYQYYGGTPVYPFGYGLSYTNFEYSNIRVSKSSATVNDTLTVSVDVKNSGTVKGKEVIQLYVRVPGGDGVNLPLIQLKGFDKIELEPNQTKSVSFTLNINDINFFDEENQKIYVPTGKYTVVAAKNAQEAKTEGALKTTVDVSGTLDSTLKQVTAVPTGVIVKGIYLAGDETSETPVPIKAQVSAYMTDEVSYEISNADEVKYTSSNEKIAVVDDEGNVKAGVAEGVATITASVTINGVSKTDEFPVVCQLIEKATDELKAGYISKLDAEYKQCVREAYSEENYTMISEIYNNAKKTIMESVDAPTVNAVFEKAIKDIRAVEADKLSDVYTIASENSSYIYENIIDYRENGIPMYTATESSITGTVTADNSCDIKLLAFKNSVAVDNSNIKWKVEKLGEYNREPAEIDYDTGVLKVKENGLIKVTAVNTEALEKGSLILLVNIQLEGESADDNDGVANLSDSKSGASGSGVEGAPNNAGSTKTAWLEFKGVKLEGLKEIVLRNSYKTDGSADLKVSLAKDAYPANLIADGSVDSTGDWAKWKETILNVKQEIISNAKIDENGLSTIYIQTNGANLDYIRFIYEEPAQYPYTFKGAENDADGSVKVTVSHKLGTESGVLVGAVFGSDGKMTKEAMTKISNSGIYTLSGGFSANDEVSLFVWNNLDEMRPISDISSVTYKEPELVVYNFSDSVFDDYYGVKNGTEKLPLPEVNGMRGYGNWIKAGGSSYTFKGKEYKFTESLQAGGGGTEQRCVYFTPKGKCKITVLFDGNGSAGRAMYIEQKGIKINTGTSIQTGITEFSADITDTSNPVYIYGGGSNKRLFAIFVEYK